jgi:hypothetical protein
MGRRIWHISKCVFVRDFAERVLNGEIAVSEPSSDSFSLWIASRLLTPDEVERFEQEGSPDDESR